MRLHVTPVPLSVLDTAPVSVGQSSGDALAASTALARTAEAAGYLRFWVAEHHSMAAVASTSPGVLLAHLAASTSTIRVGSGGVMLPNHPSLVIAEQFAMLEALHPGRVDLGIGRAPGADPMTAAALRRTVDGLGADDFPAELIDVLVLLGIPVNGHAGSLRASRLSATPAATSAPEVWLLGSSLFSAQLAGQLGLPFSYANHFNTGPHAPGRRRLPVLVPPVAGARRAAPHGLRVGARRRLRRGGVLPRPVRAA